MSCQTVVVVERDALIRDTLIEILCEEGYSAHGAKDVPEAQAALAQVPHPCLILADLLSTGMNGSDFLQMRRENDILIQIPVAVMSSVGIDPGEKDALQEQGADAYLKKPFDIDLFLRTVRRYCSAV